MFVQSRNVRRVHYTYAFNVKCKIFLKYKAKHVYHKTIFLAFLKRLSRRITYLKIQYLQVIVNVGAVISSKMLMYPDVVSYMFCLMLGVKLNYNKLCLRKSRFMFPRRRRVMTDVVAVRIPKCKHTTKPMYTRYAQDTVLQTINDCITH